MRSILSALVLSSVAILCHGAPNNTPGEQPDILIEDRGLVGRMEDQLQNARENASTTASHLVTNAMGFLGVPYKYGGTSVETGGFDCSGFVRAVYEKSIGQVLPRRASEQAANAETIDRNDLKPGDLVFFNTMRRTFSHVGIYVGDGKFIHAPRKGSHVRIEDMRKRYWQARFNGARRVLQPDVPVLNQSPSAATTPP